MARKTGRKHLLLIGLLLLSTFLVLGGWALANGGYDLSWHAIAGGGGHSSSSHYALDGSIGQPVAVTSGGGNYTLCAGFWCTEMPQRTMLPVMLKASP